MKHKILLTIITILLSVYAQSQIDSITLTLQNTVNNANSGSLSAFRAKNMYLADYWKFRTFKANRLPSLSLNMVPARYYRDITRRYDFDQNVDVFRKQQTFYANANLALQQNFDWTGGTFFVDSELGYIKNFGDKSYTQFTSVPVRIGYRQELIGYNRFKWEKKIEPIKFEKAKKDLLYNLEQTAEVSTQHFFNLAMAQAEYQLAKDNLSSTDTLYRIGTEQQKIAGIRQSELLTLKLDKVNAKNSLKNTEIGIKSAMFALASYLNLNKNSKISLVLPDYHKKIKVSVAEALQYAKNNNPQYLSSKQNILEHQQTLDKTKREAQFNIKISASVGFNQVAQNLKTAYQEPLQQDVLTLQLFVPILDWGVRKGRYNMAKNNLNVAELTARQDELKVEEEVIMTVGDFSVQQEIIISAQEALELAKMAYNQTKERFIIGKADINSLTLADNRHQQAQRNYISALRNYWLSYYKIRRLTLYDFEKHQPITISYDEIDKYINKIDSVL